MCSDRASSSKSSISQAYHDTRIFEAAVNYTKADEITSAPEEKNEPIPSNAEYIDSDEGHQLIEAIERDFPDLLED